MTEERGSDSNSNNNNNRVSQVDMNRQILHGDVFDQIKKISDESIDCIITSPPYWNMRDYLVEGQIGLEPDYRDFLKTMKKFMDECRRVLKPTGSCWINFGDSYAGSEKNPPIQSLSRYAIPERFYIQCIDDGWIARNHIVWTKTNPMPSSDSTKFTNTWQSIFFFVKSNKTLLYYNENTGQIRTTRTTSKLGGIDWEYRMCTTCKGTGIYRRMEDGEIVEGDEIGEVGEEIEKVVEVKNHKRCNGNGIYRYSFWKSQNYYFDLDPVREKNVTDSKPFNIRVRDNKNKIAHTKTSGRFSEDEDKRHNSRGELIETKLSLQCDLEGNFVSVDDSGKIIREKYADIPQSNVARLHRERKDNNLIPHTEKHDTWRKSINENNKRWNNGRPTDTDFENGKWRKHYDENENCLGCGKHWTKHTVSNRAKGSLHEASKRTEDIVWCNPKEKNPEDVFVINSKPFLAAHFATFPIELPLKILKCACPQQICSECGIPKIRGTQCNCNKPFRPGITMDPFFGAGSTGVAAEKLGLRWIGIELSQEYIDIAKKRLEPFQNDRLENF